MTDFCRRKFVCWPLHMKNTKFAPSKNFLLHSSVHIGTRGMSMCKTSYCAKIVGLDRLRERRGSELHSLTNKLVLDVINGESHGLPSGTPPPHCRYGSCSTSSSAIGDSDEVASVPTNKKLLPCKQHHQSKNIFKPQFPVLGIIKASKTTVMI